MCVIDIFSKCTWVVPLKDKNGVSIVDAIQKILRESNRKLNKIWDHKRFEFYNIFFKKWLKDNYIDMYSTHNEEKSVVAEIFIRVLKTKIYKYMTAISKTVYIDKLVDIVNENNSTYHVTSEMKPFDVKGNTYTGFKKEVNKKHPKFKVGGHVRTSKYKSIFAKGCTPNWSEEVFTIKKVKNTVPWTYVISDLNVEKITGTFYGKDLINKLLINKKTNQQEFRIEKVIKKKCDKLLPNGKVMLVY